VARQNVCTPVGAKVRRSSYAPARTDHSRTARPASSPADLTRRGKEFLAQRCVRGRGALALRIHDEIIMARNISKRPSKDLAEQPFDSVANDRAADLARNGESQAMVTQLIGPAEKKKAPAIDPPAPVVDRAIVRSANDPPAPREALVRFPIHSRSASSGPWPGAVSTRAGLPW
jgi:hypothetical protein